MKIHNKLLICLLAGFILAGTIPDHFMTASHFKSTAVVPLQKEYWSASGEINFEIDHHTQRPYIDWKPLKKNSFVRCQLPFANIQPFNLLTIELSSAKPSNAWFFIYLHDRNHHSAMSYFQLQGDKSYQLELSFQTLFSSFVHNEHFDWSHVRSLSFLSHPSANLNIQQAHLKIKNIIWSHKEETLLDYNIPLNQSVSLPVLLNQQLWDSFHNIVSHQPNETLKEAFRTINRGTIQARTHEKASLEVLRNAAIGMQLFEQDFPASDLIEKTMLYDPPYWKGLYQRNDILVQEEALYFIQIYETLLPLIQQNDLYLRFFADTMRFIAELQRETILYWIRIYPFGQGNNHVSRPACILAIIALLYPENDPLRKEWLNFSFYTLSYYIDFQISSEGVLNEGTHYYVYLMETLSYLAYYLKATTELNLFFDFPFSEKLEKMVHWTHQIENPQGYLPCIDDSWPTGVVFPKMFLKPFFHETNKEFYWDHKLQPWNLLKGSYFPLYLINADSMISDHAQNANLPGHSSFFTDSQAVFRSNKGENNYYLFLSGKNMFSLHEHDSAGSFQYFMNDQPVLTVSGYGPQGWVSKHRSYYVSGHAHNTFMIENEAPKGFYNGGIGPIDTTALESWQDISQTGYAHLNISWDTRFPEISHHRHWVMLPDHGEIKGSLIVFDQLLSPLSRSYHANLHPAGEILFQGGNQLFFSNHDDPKETVSRIYHNSPWKRTLQKGFHSDYWGKEYEKEYVRFSQEASNAFLVTLIQPKTSLLNPGTKELHHSHPVADEFILQYTHPNSFFADLFHVNPYRFIHQTSNMGSNASFSHIRYNHKEMRVDRCYIKEGTFLNYGNKNIFHAQSPLTLSLSQDPHEDSYNLTYHSTQDQVKIFFYNTQVQEIVWNDQFLPVERFSDRISFILPKGHHVLQLRYEFQKE